MAKSRILLVDADARSARVVEVSLRQAGYNVTAATDLPSAFARIEVQLPDLVLCDPRLGNEDGYELLRVIRRRPDAAALPIVLLLGARSGEDRIRGIELGIEDFVKKPIFVKELLARVDLALARGAREELSRAGSRTMMRGSLEDMTVLDLLQTFDVSKKSGVVHVVNAAHDAKIHLRNGDVVDAELGALRGEEAIYRALTWRTGAFEVVFENVDRPDLVTTPVGALLLEGMRRVDEWQRIAEELPPLNAILVLDRGAYESRRLEIPPELDGIIDLFDGRRSIYDVVDASPFDDLSTLATLAKLYFEGILRLSASRVPAPMLELTPRPPGSVRPPPNPVSDALAELAAPVPTLLPKPEVTSAFPPASAPILAPSPVPPGPNALEEPRELPAFTSVEAPADPVRDGNTLTGLAPVSRSSIPDPFEAAPSPRSSRPDPVEVVPETIVFDKPSRPLSFTNEPELEAEDERRAASHADSSDDDDHDDDDEPTAVVSRRVSGKTVAILLASIIAVGVLGILIARTMIRGEHDTRNGLELRAPDAATSASVVPDAAPPPSDSAIAVPVPAPTTSGAPADAGLETDAGRVAVVPRVPEDEVKVEELLARAQRRIDEGNYSAAVHEARRATEREPGNPEAWLTLGAAYQARGDSEAARAAYRKCIVRAKGARLDECRALAGE